MRRLGVIAAALALAASTCGDAEAKVRCGSGTTAYVEGGLRIFGMYFREPDEWGFNEYACSGRGRPLLVGGRGSSTGLASGDTPAYAVGGDGRYLAAYNVSDGEGGPSASIQAWDLRTRRTVAFLNLGCCEGVPAFRVASNGALVVLEPGEGVMVKPRGRPAKFVSGPEATDLAASGDTVYWTEGSEARSATVAGAAVTDADRMLEPVVMRRRGGPCAALRGRTIAASGSVRVVDRGGERVACRIGRPGRFAAGGAGGRAPQIVGDRWLLLRGEGSATVLDSRTGREVVAVTSAAWSALLRDGTLAWIDFGGQLLVKRPGSDPLVVAAAGASALVAARRAVYWTEGGVVRRYRP